MGFGHRLKSLMEAKGLTQAQLADLSGVSQQAISFVTSTDGDPRWSTVCALAKALGVSTEDFRPEPDRGPPAPDKVVTVTISTGDVHHPVEKKLTEVIVTAAGAIVPKPTKPK